MSLDIGRKSNAIIRPVWNPALLSCLLLGGCFHLAYPAPEAPELLFATTSDGWRLAMHHYPAAGAPRPTPVVLCHGVTSDVHNWDLAPGPSLPRYLAARGFDVYAVELRAAGESDRLGWSYTVDDYALQDVPAVVDAVARRGASGQVHWVGHSMGGLVMYGYLQRVSQAKVRSVTAIASPPAVLDPADDVTLLRRWYPVVDFFLDRLPSGLLAELAAPWAHDPPVPTVHVVWNPDNVAPEVARAAAANAVNDVSAGVLGQFVDAGERGGSFLSSDGTWNYSAGMSRIRVPIYFLAGTVDLLSPPEAMAFGFRAVASADKRIEVFGTAEGHRVDYGHTDLVLGRDAPKEVFPRVEEWLRAHD